MIALVCDRWLVEAPPHVEPPSRRRTRGGPPQLVEAGAEAKASSARTQKIKLTLEPHVGGTPCVRPDIYGDEVTGET